MQDNSMNAGFQNQEEFNRCCNNGGNSVGGSIWWK